MDSLAGLTRWDRSPAAILPAVASIRFSGRSPRRTTSEPTIASASSTAAITSASTSSRWCSVCATSVVGTAAIVSPPVSTSRVAKTRYCRPEEPTDPTVNSLPTGTWAGSLGAAGVRWPKVMKTWRNTFPEASRSSP